MCAGADEVKVVAIDLVDEQPVWLQVALAVVLPFSDEWVVFEPRRGRAAFGEERD